MNEDAKEEDSSEYTESQEVSENVEVQQVELTQEIKEVLKQHPTHIEEVKGNLQSINDDFTSLKSMIESEIDTSHTLFQSAIQAHEKDSNDKEGRSESNEEGEGEEEKEDQIIEGFDDISKSQYYKNYKSTTYSSPDVDFDNIEALIEKIGSNLQILTEKEDKLVSIFILIGSKFQIVFN